MRGSRPNGHHFLFLFLFLALRSALPDGRFVVDATPTLKPLTKELTHGIMPRIMSLRDLGAFDGSDVSLPIYIAVRGVIFDVTEGKRFYGKGAAYNALAGRESTRAVAKMSLEEGDLTDDLTGLTEAELEALEGRFEDTYRRQYPVVGFTVKAIGENMDLFAGNTVKEEL